MEISMMTANHVKMGREDYQVGGCVVVCVFAPTGQTIQRLSQKREGES